MKRRVLAAGILAAILALGVAATASARSVSTYTFYGCTSTDGSYVPSTFVAVKTALPAAAGFPVSSAGAFVVVGSTDTYTVYDFGFGAPHGIDVSGVATAWCWVQYSNYPTPVLVGGQYNP